MLRSAEPADLACSRDARKVAFDERDACAFDGDVGTGAHRDADGRSRQRRSVIDAIAGHGHDPSFSLQPADLVRFLIGQYAGDHLTDAELAGDGMRGGRCVASEHDDAQAICAQCAQRCRRAGLDWIGDGEQARRCSGPGEEHHGLSLGLELRGKLAQWAGRGGLCLEQGPIAERDRRAFHDASDPAAGQ